MVLYITKKINRYELVEICEKFKDWCSGEILPFTFCSGKIVSFIQ